MSNQKKQSLAISVLKEDDMSKWYTEVIQKAGLADYTKVSGCIVYMPKSYEIWEFIRDYFDSLVKKTGVRNCYFPTLIPKSLLTKEEDHVDGFAPEVAWVDYGGNTKLGERLAVRPTSETIMYDSYSKWIRSYKDLPLKLNQWNSVVRWEFKHATPFLRGREFLWQEGHTAFEKKEEADKEVFEILNFYKMICENLLALPVETGLKSINEKFAGSSFSTTIESFMPDFKVLQSGTSHSLGQNFSKAFDIKFEKENKFHYPYQNSWGISTRIIGAMIMAHSDNKGFVCPPNVSVNKIVIVPLLFKGKEEVVLKKAKEIEEKLKDLNPILDDNLDESAGFKFSKWEMRGIPLRLEIGPKDIEKNEFVLVRRDTLEKKSFDMKNIENISFFNEILENIQSDLFNKAKNFLEENTTEVKTKEELIEGIENKKRVLVPWFQDEKSEKEIKELIGAKTSCIPIKYNKHIFEKYELPKELKVFEEKSLENVKCFFDKTKNATCWVYFSKSH